MISTHKHAEDSNTLTRKPPAQILKQKRILRTMKSSVPDESLDKADLFVQKVRRVVMRVNSGPSTLVTTEGIDGATEVKEKRQQTARKVIVADTAGAD